MGHSLFQDLRDPPIWQAQSLVELNERAAYIFAEHSTALVVLFLVAFAVLQSWRQWRKIQAQNARAGYLPAPGFPEIESLSDFEWQKTEPIKVQPFKAKYHLTMALENLPPSELVLMDKNYHDRIKYRSTILKDSEKRPEVINIDPKSREAIYPAIAEFYTWLLSHYLPLRYPKMFKLHQTYFEYGQEFMLENRVTGSLVPARAKSGDDRELKAERMLETLASMVDEDFLFLLPEDVATGKKTSEVQLQPGVEKQSATTETTAVRERKPGSASIPAGPGPSKTTALASNPPDFTPETALAPPTPATPYILCAYSTVCPNGFRPSDKLGNPLRVIHEPVPSYEDRIANSMDKFFNKIEVGKYVRRANWSVMTGDSADELFKAPMKQGDGTKTHAYEGDELEEKLLDIDGDRTYLRTERQTLHRLPSSGALVFAFKTYLYPLSEIKSEPESREAFLAAIDGLNKGNAPGMRYYKRGSVWGEGVMKYLTS